MIHYHGAAGVNAKFISTVFPGRHAFISYAYPHNLSNISNICSTFSLDNGAFTKWKKKEQFDFTGYEDFVRNWYNHPAYDFHLIPDIIDGTEKDNLKLIESWPLDGVPVWHLHESLDYLHDLASNFKKIAIGSSGDYSVVGSSPWWYRVEEAFNKICIDGRPICKIHGLRMLRIKVFSKLPFHSADSTTVVRDCKYDKNWTGYNSPKSVHIRGLVIADRLESFQSAPYFYRKINDNMSNTE